VELLLTSYTVQEQHALDYSGHAAIHVGRSIVLPFQSLMTTFCLQWALRVSELPIIRELVRHDDTALILRTASDDTCVHLLVREQRVEVRHKSRFSIELFELCFFTQLMPVVVASCQAVRHRALCRFASLT